MGYGRITLQGPASVWPEDEHCTTVQALENPVATA